jgi:hypothetical protein
VRQRDTSMNGHHALCWGSYQTTQRAASPLLEASLTSLPSIGTIWLGLAAAAGAGATAGASRVLLAGAGAAAGGVARVAVGPGCGLRPSGLRLPLIRGRQLRLRLHGTHLCTVSGQELSLASSLQEDQAGRD